MDLTSCARETFPLAATESYQPWAALALLAEECPGCRVCSPLGDDGEVEDVGWADLAGRLG